MRNATKLMFAVSLTLGAGSFSLAACGESDDGSLANQADGLRGKGKKNQAQACGGLQGLACGDGEFCNYPEEAICGAADATGVCTPVPEFCTEQYEPVCGCDDKTYGNACAANMAGVSVAAKGECEGDGPSEPVPGCETDGGAVSPATCGGIAGLECGAGEWCNYEVEAGGTGCEGIADASGVCQPQVERLCTADYTPVCGCDGKTYSNSCHAHNAGVSVARKGECEGGAPGGKVCGGLLGGQCAADEFCNFEGHTNDCGLADGTGICEKKPDACTLQYDPVCGCDGKTHGNACAAHSLGVAIASKGECGAPAKLANCDQRDVLCKRATPKCPAGTLPSVVGTCYGDCVPAEQCGCSEAAECPQPDSYTCHMSAGHCGPYVN
jgi:hypothetical protein